MPSRDELWRQKRLREQKQKDQVQAEEKRLLAEYLQTKTLEQAVVAEEESRLLKQWMNLREASSNQESA